MEERSVLRLKLAATLVSNVDGMSDSSVEQELLRALGLADRLIELQEVQDKIDAKVRADRQLAAFTTLGQS